MKNTEELKGLVKEVFSDQLKASEKRAEAREQEWQKAFDEKSAKERDEIIARIKKIEETPTIKTRLAIPGKENQSTEVFLGHRVDKQLRDIFVGQRCEKAKDLVVNPKLFPIMADADKQEHYAKHLLMIMKAARGDFQAQQKYSEWKEKAALNEGTNAQGGYLVPEEYADEIIAFARLSSFALQNCRIWPMGSDTLHVPTENTKVSVAWKGEAVAAGQTEPTLGEIELVANKLTAYSIASKELLDDANVDVVSYLTEIFAEANGQELDNQVLNGTGSPVSGILTAAAGKSVVMTTGNAAFSSISGDNLLDMIDEIDQQAEDGAQFLFHKNIMTYIRKLKDSQNQYLFAPVAGGVPGNIWDYPYIRTPKGPAKGDSGASTAFVAFGNLKYFALGRRMAPMALELDPYGKFLENQVRFKTVSRWGFGFYPNAFCRLVTAAS